MKYSPDELKDMALTVLDDEVSGGGRSLVLYMSLSTITGLSPAAVREQILGLAR